MMPSDRTIADLICFTTDLTSINLKYEIRDNCIHIIDGKDVLLTDLIHILNKHKLIDFSEVYK